MRLGGDRRRQSARVLYRDIHSELKGTHHHMFCLPCLTFVFDTSFAIESLNISIASIVITLWIQLFPIVCTFLHCLVLEIFFSHRLVPSAPSWNCLHPYPFIIHVDPRTDNDVRPCNRQSLVLDIGPEMGIGMLRVGVFQTGADESIRIYDCSRHPILLIPSSCSVGSVRGVASATPKTASFD